MASTNNTASINTEKYELTDHLGNVIGVVTRGAYQKYFSDYYPFGMPMPNRNNINNNYRYAYQGQEKDPETGKEAFELRLWDSRIGRWLTTDPAGQFSSPYLGMSNNPMNGVDPDGAWHYENGHLVSDTGDTEASLATFLNVSQSVAHDIAGKEGFLGNYTTDAGGFMGGQTAMGSYSFTGNTASVRSANYRYMNVFTPMHMQSQQDWKPFLMGEAGAMAAPIILPSLELGSLKVMGTNMVIDFTTEMIANGGDINEVNLLGVGISAFTGKGGGVISSAVSVNWKGEVKLNSPDQVIVNVIAGEAMGKLHDKSGLYSRFLNVKGFHVGGAYIKVADILGQSLIKNVSSKY